MVVGGTRQVPGLGLRRHSSDELLVVLEHVASLEVVAEEELVHVDGVAHEIKGRLATELVDLVHLVEVVAAWEDGSLDEEFNCSAAKRPHVDALVIERLPFAHLVEPEGAHEHFRRSVVPALNVGVHLLAVESRIAKVNQFHVESIFCHQDVLWFEVAVNEAFLFHRDQGFEGLSYVVSDSGERQTTLCFLDD